MPLPLTAGASSLVVRRESFERTGFSRATIDQALTLTDEEFRVERDLVVIGPLYAVDGVAALVDSFERAGLVYYDDFFELSGNWPDWLVLYAQNRDAPSR